MKPIDYRELSKMLWRAAGVIREMKGNHRPPGARSNEEWAAGVARIGNEAARLAEQQAPQPAGRGMP